MNTSTLSLQFLPPLSKDEVFEDFIVAFFNRLEKTNSYTRFGVSGQKQHGLDVYSNETKTAIQCKLKRIDRPVEKIRRELLIDLDSDFNSFKAFIKGGNLSFRKYIFATTYRADTQIEEQCMKMSGDIIVEYWSWNRIISKIDLETIREYFGEFYSVLEDFYTPKIISPNETKNAEIVSLDIKLPDPNETQSIENINVDIVVPLIDQLHNLFLKYTSEISFYPIHLLKDQIPFRIKECYKPYYSHFTLTTDNEELFELLSSIKINKDKVTIKDKKFIEGVENAEEKIKYVIKKLSEHLIFYVNSDKKSKPVNIRYTHEVECNCMRCNFHRLKYTTVLKNIQSNESSDDIQLQAYMHYTLGNYVKSANLWKEIAAKEKEKGNLTRYAIAQFNLSNLYIFIFNILWGEESNDILLDELKQINPVDLFCQLKTEENKKTLDWVLNSRFYHSKKNKISKIRNKIKEHYYSSLKGGWNSNNYIGELINEFAELETFVEGNYIIYDKFTDYQEIVDDFLEGLFASYAIEDNKGGTLKHFDDWILKILVFKAHPDKISKYFFRYKLEPLKYKKTSEIGDSFLDLVNNHFSDYENLISSVEKYSEKGNDSFWDMYYKVYSNILLILSFSDIQGAQLNEIAETILKYLQNTNFIYYPTERHLRFFISSKGKYFTKRTLYDYLELFIVNGNYHKPDYIETVLDIFRKEEIKFEISNKNLQEVIRYVFDECNQCGKKHEPYVITAFYDCIQKDSQRKLISDRITVELKQKYDQYLYYVSVIWGALDENNDFFQKFIDSAKEKNKSFKEFFSGKESVSYSKANMLANMCFKLNLDLADSKFDYFRGINDYYNWLFGMSDFNYDNFDPLWVLEYDTKYFYEEFKKHPKIKDKVVEYLKENNDERLNTVLVKII